MAGTFDVVASQLGIPLWLFIIAIVWSLVWKAFALWKSARLKQPIWFVALLIINTLGILEILYIYVFSNLSGKKSKKKRR